MEEVKKKSMHYFEFQPRHLNNPTRVAIDWSKKDVLDVAKIRIKKNFYYISVIAGYPGTGKSTLARTDAAYVDPNFHLGRICFEAHGKDGFIEVSNKIPEESAIVLDESFKAFNARGQATRDFQDILNHLQLLRQRRLYIFLCIPNWYNLSMTISLELSSHLFYTYATRLGVRGKFLAFGRDTKRRLWVKGKRFMNYSAEKCDFIGRFYSNRDKIVDEAEYNKRKLQHLKDQAEKREEGPLNNRNHMINKLNIQEGWKTGKIAEFFNLKPHTITDILRPFKKIVESVDV